MHTDHLALLELMHLADSALPVGTAAHSFGLEALIAEEKLDVLHLESFLHDYLEEAGIVEGAFCRLGYRLASLEDQAVFSVEWLDLNDRLSALKTARESRAASAALGRRFLQLFLSLKDERHLLG
jgi:urease accessory protein